MIERGRFAPTPSGRLHIGSARTALASQLAARLDGGQHVLRVEDLDAARTKPGMVDAMLEDLAWVGVEFDEGFHCRSEVHRPYLQSERGALYAAALEVLRARGDAYPCACSRAEVEQSATAPHGAEPVYPGRCRDRAHGEIFDEAKRKGRSVAWRFRARGGVIGVDDEVAGRFEQDVARSVGDFVVFRADGVAAYQLAVVVDDIAMEITQVVRGVDLLASTPRQVLLYEALGAEVPRYAHVGLVVDDNGGRLAKRDAGLSIAELRDAGADPAAIRGALLRSLGAVAAHQAWRLDARAAKAVSLGELRALGLPMDMPSKREGV